jgi:hypothetical protein
LDAGFSNLIDNHVGVEAFKNGGVLTADSPRITEVTDNKCKIAHILPVFCRQAHAIVGVGELDMGNEYMVAMDQVPDLEAFAAVIYSSNLEYELAEGDDEARAARVEPPVEPKQSSFVESQTIASLSKAEEESGRREGFGQTPSSRRRCVRKRLEEGFGRRGRREGSRFRQGMRSLVEIQLYVVTIPALRMSIPAFCSRPQMCYP